MNYTKKSKKELDDELYMRVKQRDIHQYQRICAFCSICGPPDLDVKWRAQIERFIMSEVDEANGF